MKEVSEKRGNKNLLLEKIKQKVGISYFYHDLDLIVSCKLKEILLQKKEVRLNA